MRKPQRTTSARERSTRWHVAGAIAKAQERREERIVDNIFEESRRVLAKA
jgi:hypothetical protein